MAADMGQLQAEESSGWLMAVAACISCETSRYKIVPITAARIRVTNRSRITRTTKRSIMLPPLLH
jgi:hypothetical protein